ncbi:MAG: DUF262 domain-containing protein [Firmicutes bacterium]|nr:DUF262 domain-containing protein [Bacillota bacterium]
MSDINGTIITINRFFKDEESLLPRDCSRPNITLEKSRQYIVPKYQREIRWQEKQAHALLKDISDGSKFLGNIILSKKRSSQSYDIVDGQQRLTVILIIIEYFVANKDKSIQKCEFKLDSFSQFDKLCDIKFDKSKINQEMRDADDYNQIDRYCEIYELVSNFFVRKPVDSCNRFWCNLNDSKINLIVSTDETKDIGIDIYLDVNLKALPLDDEDVFKVNFFKFAYDNVDKAKNIWVKFKQEFFNFEKKLGKSKSQKGSLTTILLLEYCMRSFFYDEEKYKNIEFFQNFLLKEDIEDSNFGSPYKGTHLLSVIQDYKFAKKCVELAIEFIKFATNIIDNKSPNEEFVKYFDCSDKEYSQHNNICDIFHYELKSIIKGNFVVAKSFVVKFFVEYIYPKSKNSKKEYEIVHSIFLLGVLFCILDGTKELKDFYDLLKTNKSQLNKKVLDIIKSKYLDKFEFDNKSISKRGKVVKPDEDNSYLSKTFAIVYNFFKLNNDTLQISNIKEFKKFVTYKEDYSIEHFLINNNKSKKVKYSLVEYTYPEDAYKIKDSIFNFIFIKDELNKECCNLDVKSKLEKINETTLSCKYTKMYLQTLKGLEHTTKPYLEKTQEIDKEKFESFYDNKTKFIANYVDFANKLFTKIRDKLYEN